MSWINSKFPIISRSEVTNPRVADRLHPLWDRWPTQHPEHSPFWRQPTEATQNDQATQLQGSAPGSGETSRVIWGHKVGTNEIFTLQIFTCPKYFWAKTWAISLFDPRSIPEASPLSLQSSSYFFESSQGRWPWQLHRIYDSGLTTAKLRQVMMHLGLDAKNVSKDHGWKGINQSIQQESIGK